MESDDDKYGYYDWSVTNDGDMLYATALTIGCISLNWKKCHRQPYPIAMSLCAVGRVVVVPSSFVLAPSTEFVDLNQAHTISWNDSNTDYNNHHIDNDHRRHCLIRIIVIFFDVIIIAGHRIDPFLCCGFW